MSNSIFNRLKKLGNRPEQKPGTKQNPDQFEYGGYGKSAYKTPYEPLGYKPLTSFEPLALDGTNPPVQTRLSSATGGGNQGPSSPSTIPAPRQPPPPPPPPSLPPTIRFPPSAVSERNAVPAELDGTPYGLATPISSSSSVKPYVQADNRPVPPVSNANRVSGSHQRMSPASISSQSQSLSPITSNEATRVGNVTPVERKYRGQSQQASAQKSTSNNEARQSTAASSPSPAVRTQYNPPSLVIIVMGLTGAGKSRFVKEATGLNVDVGHSLVSATAEITPYEISFGDRYGFLIDTPGFDDTYRTDVEIFREVADWLARQYAHHELLTSIIYVHRITDSRVAGSALRNLTVMKKMLGVESFRNLMLVTSMWDLVELEVGEQREKELADVFWTDLLRAGATMQRFRGDRPSALQILTEMRSEARVTLTIQRELVDDGLQLDRTTAGTYLEREVLRTNAQEKLDIYLHAEQLNEGSQRAATESRPSQDAHSSIGRSSTLLKAYWSAGSKSLNQGNVATRQHQRDPEMYSPFEWENDFRLVVLRAGSGSSPIEISLVMADVTDPPEFIALSYVVGREPSDMPINFRRDRWLSQLYISVTLKEALQQLRLPDIDVLIWVDAISINQDDLEERARQVRMMSLIFRAAEGVCIWLGPAVDGGDIAMDFIPSILDFSILENLVNDDQHQQKWLLLAKLMSRPWFRRRWVVQELIFARDATIHCGDRVATWDDFCDAATLFRTKWSEIQRFMGESELAELGDAHLLGAIALMEISQRVFRRDADGNILEKLLSTENLLSLLPMFEITDLLDAVYSILDMANDMRGPDSVVINYQQQPAELFSNTIKLVVGSTGSLDIICRPWAPKSGLPSWITTIAKHTYKRRINHQQYDRQNGVSLVGMPGTNFYRACGVMKATSENTKFRVEGDQHVLSVTGQNLGHIAELGDRSINGNIPQEWMELAGWRSLDEPSPPSFWRTIVANRAFDGSPAPAWYGRACEFAFRKSNTDDINTTALIRSAPSSHVQEFLNRVLEVTWRRTFALVQNNDRVLCALCPPETAINDIVCILYGCSVPVVLRRVVSYYQLVGECFVYGVMDGEAVSQESQSTATFDII